MTMQNRCQPFPVHCLACAHLDCRCWCLCSGSTCQGCCPFSSLQSHHATSCHATLCHAVPCCAMLCHAVPCYAMETVDLACMYQGRSYNPNRKFVGRVRVRARARARARARVRARARARVRVMMTMIHTTLRPKPKRKPNCTAAHSERHCCFTCQRCSGRWSEVAPQTLGSPAACYSCCACPLKAAYQARFDWPHLSDTCMKARVSQQRLSLPALLMSS